MSPHWGTGHLVRSLIIYTLKELVLSAYAIRNKARMMACIAIGSLVEESYRAVAAPNGPPKRTIDISSRTRSDIIRAGVLR